MESTIWSYVPKANVEALLVVLAVLQKCEEMFPYQTRGPLARWENTEAPSQRPKLPCPTVFICRFGCWAPRCRSRGLGKTSQKPRE
jgi:hypothetical protein